MITDYAPFSIARLPHIEFGSGKFKQTAHITSKYGKRLLLVTGASSFTDSIYWQDLLHQFETQNISHVHLSIDGEPSPTMVDEAVEAFSTAEIEVVLGIGGGSAMDAAKAIAGLLNVKQSVMDFLEGVGPELTYHGPNVPFVAVPTTAGTGSEATKNAVLSLRGKDGFKKSFRDERLIAEVAIVDPDLLSTCPPAVIAANGMDALTQLIESFVSIKANVFNDALGVSGLRAARDGLLNLYRSSGTDASARECMAYASLVSGINLAQTGLGSVHGLASPLGAFYPIPHGIACGTLIAAATSTNINAMIERDSANPALMCYARISEILWQKRFKSTEDALESLIELLQRWTEEMALEGLSGYGVNESGLDQLVKHSRAGSMKTNPIILTDDELKSILRGRM
jgi:alcohol dehydrogenase